VNFVAVLSPFVFVLLGKYFLRASVQTTYVESLVFLLLAALSLLMLLFLLFDFIFSSSIGYYTKTSVPVAKSGAHKKFSGVFESVKKKFALSAVELYIESSDEINAYAVGSLRRNIVVLTTGLLNLYRFEVDDSEKFLASVEGIIAHEMSHIVNKDYFVALLLMVNERATNFISGLVAALFELLSKIFSLIPVVGQYIALALDMTFSAINFIIGFFYRHVMLNLYRFIQLQISKSVEYRADRQAAEVVGGPGMARTLSLLGSGGYFSIFSSHPLTRDRIRSVVKVKKSEKTIESLAGTNLTFAVSFAIILTVLYLSYRLARIQVLLEAYREMALLLRNRYILVRTRIAIFLNRYFAR
jgi:Zn-dependent protease with chaperone function